LDTLVTRIEYYLKKMLGKQGRLRIQRNEVAARFDCAPSQVSYVLQTRFSLDRGYLVQSQRGGGGYVEIVEIPREKRKEYLSRLHNSLGSGVTQQEALDILHRLERDKLLTRRECLLLQNIVRRDILDISLPRRDILRGKILKSVIESLYWNLHKEG